MLNVNFYLKYKEVSRQNAYKICLNNLYNKFLVKKINILIALYYTLLHILYIIIHIYTLCIAYIIHSVIPVIIHLIWIINVLVIVVWLHKVADESNCCVRVSNRGPMVYETQTLPLRLGHANINEHVSIYVYNLHLQFYFTLNFIFMLE